MSARTSPTQQSSEDRVDAGSFIGTVITLMSGTWKMDRYLFPFLPSLPLQTVTSRPAQMPLQERDPHPC